MQALAGMPESITATATFLPSICKTFYFSIPTACVEEIVELPSEDSSGGIPDMTWNCSHRDGQVTITITGQEGWCMSLLVFSSGPDLRVIRRLSFNGTFVIPWSDIQTLSTDDAARMQLTVECTITPSPLIDHPAGVAYSPEYNDQALAFTGPPDRAGLHDTKFLLPGGKSLYVDSKLMKAESPVFRRFFDGQGTPGSVLDATAAEADSDDEISPTDSIGSPQDSLDTQYPVKSNVREIVLPNVSSFQGTL